MKSRFYDAVVLVFNHEGGYVNDPHDAGGETNFGISKRAYPHLNIKDLTREEAQKIYKDDYWNKIRGDSLPFPIALIAFDMAVNMGVKTAIKALQSVLGVRVDGIFGDRTMEAAHTCEVYYIAEQLTSARIYAYTQMESFKHYGRGWINRSVEMLANAIMLGARA